VGTPPPKKKNVLQTKNGKMPPMKYQACEVSFFSCSPFDLGLIQYDAMNAFLHTMIDEKNFMKLSQISKTRDDDKAQQSITWSSEIAFNFGRKSWIQHYKP
jgi:hypothetical protein